MKKKLNVKEGKAACVLVSRTDKTPTILYLFLYVSKRSLTNNNSVVILCKYQSRLPIAETKYQGLLKLFEQKVIPLGYKNLPHGTHEPKKDYRGESEEIYKLDII